MRPDDYGSPTLEPLAVSLFPIRTPEEGPIAAEAHTLSGTAGDPRIVADQVAGRTHTAQSGLTGVIADAMDNADAPSRRAAEDLSRLALVGGGAYLRFADFVGEFNTSVRSWNSQIRFAGDAKAQHQKKASLHGAYAGAVETLEGHASQVAGWLKDPLSDETVKALFVAGALPAQTRTLFPHADIAPKDAYESALAKIARGDMPRFADMDEQERQEFLAQNPGVLEYLMEQDDPSQQVKDDVVALALPHIDSDDADADVKQLLDALDGKVDPQTFQDAFGNMSDLSAALAVFLPWANKHQVSATPPALSYLKRFVDGTAGRMKDITEYIKADDHRYETGETKRYRYSTVPVYAEADGFDAADQNGLLENLANAYLGVSNEHLGGGWDDLPESVRNASDQVFTSEWQYNMYGGVNMFVDNDDFRDLSELLVHGDIEAGDSLSKHLGSTAMASNAAYDNYWSKQPGGDRQGPWDDELSGDILDLVSRNHDAASDLLSGEGDLPSTYSQTVFNSTLFGHDWSNDGGASSPEQNARHMLDWIHESYTTGGHEQDLADRAFEGLASSLTETDGDVFKNLMGPDGESAAKNNHALTLALTDALSDHLDQLSADPTSETGRSLGLEKQDQVRLLTLIASDHDTGDGQSAAVRLATFVDAYERDRVYDWADHPADGPRTLAGPNARLSAMLDSAMSNEAEERGLNVNDAEAERVRNTKIASGIVAGLVGKIPVAGEVLGPVAGVGNTLLANLTTAEHLPSPESGISADWSPDGSHIAYSNAHTLVDALVRNGSIDPDDVPEALHDPAGHSRDELNDAADRILTDYFTNHPPHDESFFDDVYQQATSSYSDELNWYSLSHNSDEEIREFLTDPNWGSKP